MDTLSRYRRIVREVLMPLTERRYSGRDVQNEAVFDEAADRFVVLSVGWQGRTRRIHHTLVHVDIINGKVWIQQDGTEDGITDDLLAAGIPKDDIVLAFHPVDIRPLTGFAVA